jgi:hypothetical protein
LAPLTDLIARVPGRSPIGLASVVDGINGIRLERRMFIFFERSNEVVQVRDVCAGAMLPVLAIDESVSSQSLEVIEVPDGGDVGIMGDDIENIKVVVAGCIRCYDSNHLVVCRRKV